MRPKGDTFPLLMSVLSYCSPPVLAKASYTTPSLEHAKSYMSNSDHAEEQRAHARTTSGK